MARRSSGEGTVCRRTDGRWAASVQVGGKRFWVYGQTRKEATERLQELQAKARDGALVAPSRLTVEQFLMQWISSVRLTRRLSTVHGYEDVVTVHLIPALGAIKLQKLTAAHLLMLYKQKREAGLSARRVGIIHAVLRAALGDAVRWGLVASNVAATVKPPRQEERELPMWTRDEMRRFVAVATASSDPYAAALILLLTLGLRLSELLGLCWDAVDLDAGTVTVSKALVWAGKQAVWGKPKSKAGYRALPLPVLARDALMRLRAWQEETGVAGRNTDGRVVCTATGGIPTANCLKRVLWRLCDEAGIPRLNVHGLRHAFASVLIAGGVDIKQAQALLGHSRAVTTVDTYAALLPAPNGAQAVAAMVQERVTRDV